MKKWLRFLKIGAASLLVAATLAGCGIVTSGDEPANDKPAEKEKDDKVVIGFSMATLKEERWQNSYCY